MSFSIQPKTLKKLIDFYHPSNHSQQMKYMLFLKGQDQMYMNLQTSPFQGISQNSIQQRIAWFGANKVQPPYDYTMVDVIVKSFTQYTCMLWTFCFSLILLIISIFFSYNNLPLPYIQGLSGLVLFAVNTALILVIQVGKYLDLRKIYDYRSEDNYCDVCRQNQMKEIDIRDVVVGDVVELGIGAVVPADGWIIEGEMKVEETFSHGVIQTSKTTMKGCINHLVRNKRQKSKRYTIANKIKPQAQETRYSPVVLGGSTVIQGQGRMLVFCVNKYSRKGQFQSLLKTINPYKNSSLLQSKMQDYTAELFKYGLLGVIILVIGLFIKQIITNIVSPDLVFKDLLNFQQFQHIILSLNLILVLIPQGCIFGLGLGLLIHKKKIQHNNQVIIKQLSYCQAMSYVEYICHEKQKQKSYFKIREWWSDSGKVQMNQNAADEDVDQLDGQQQEEEQRMFKNVGEVNSIYLKFFRNAMTVTSKNNRDFKSQRSQKSLKYGSFRNLDQCFIDYTRKKSYLHADNISEQQIIEQIPYDNIRKRTVIVTECPQDMDLPQIPSQGLSNSSNFLIPPSIPMLHIKQKRFRVSLKVEDGKQITGTMPKLSSKDRLQKKVVIYVRGKQETVLELCSYIMIKQTGRVVQITQKKALEIKANVESMLRRQLRAVVLAYKVTTRRDNFHEDSAWEQEAGYVLLAIIGINDTRSTSDFELVAKIKQLDVNLMIASSMSMEDSVSAANQIGIIKADESSILINGSQFIHIVGGINCDKCKKGICECPVDYKQEKGNHKIKNIDEFERILKHLDVMANAQAFHKYTLAIGLKNKNICMAITGRKFIDVPSMLQSQVSLFSLTAQNQTVDKDHVQLQKAASSIQIPNNSVQTLFSLIKESRICHKFIRRFLRLTTCSSVVSAVVLVISLILFKQDFGVKLIHVFWIQTVIMILLAIAMALDSQTQDNENFSIMNESVKSYDKDQPLIDSEGWKQIIIYSLTQLILLLILIFIGPLFVPEKQDDIDGIIGSDWSAKYSDQTRSTICPGLPYSLQDSSWLYNTTFQKYKIFSRHQTMVFALFSVMQIFNYFNFRQFNMKQINIFKNCKLLSLFIVVVALSINILLVQNVGKYMGLYVNGLIFQQWVICIGVSMILWVVGIVARLFPNMRKDEVQFKVKWQNKAYNLAVKTVVTRNALLDFEVDQYFELRPDAFSGTTRKID